REHIFGMSNIVILDKNMDVYPILPFTDVLITDYSSIYYDYILMENKGIILFPFDYDEYIKNSRDLAFDYLTYTPGCKAWNFEELYRLLFSESKLVPEERSWVIKQFWGDNYMESNKKIFEALKGILKI
ncbi:MAG: CDP-glycerol glycerophosphotransferase family protein, partial [Prevotella sp.]|nr:CDP-glycerol glycerophosphotransferase family protein [Prevotella sp.]